MQPSAPRCRTLACSAGPPLPVPAHTCGAPRLEVQGQHLGHGPVHPLGTALLHHGVRPLKLQGKQRRQEHRRAQQGAHEVLQQAGRGGKARAAR